VLDSRVSRPHHLYMSDAFSHPQDLGIMSSPTIE
jgi:hypothetical protein